MTISKRIADGAIVDYMTLITVLWNSAEFLKYGRQYEQNRANKKLETIKKDIKRLLSKTRSSSQTVMRIP